MPENNHQQTPQNIFPILSFNKLAFMLRIEPNELKKLSKTAGNYYEPFDRKIIKENGKVKWRHIDNPTFRLKKIQQKINKVLLKTAVKSLPSGMTGGISGRSIFTNAIQHLRQQAVATLDLKDCFPKTDNKRIFKVWRNYLGTSESVANILTKLTTFQRRLPQGAPPSSSLCNLSLLPLYRKIEKYCIDQNLNLTLYVDDITVSGKSEAVRQSIRHIVKIIQENGHAVRKSKVKIMLANRQQKITGLVVNKKMSISTKRREGIRKEILNLSNQGVFSSKKMTAIWGKINYVKHVSPKQGEKLANFAHTLLLDMLDSEDYEKIVSEKDVTRKCKNTKRHKYGL